ncbi:PucR family transcriptional regulator [Zavarzinia aquatilis]|nr:helix-turn-helix domain-containing protein [Zavarzinia aquatilis]
MTLSTDPAAWVRRVAAALLPDTHAIGGEVARQIGARMPEIAAFGASETVLTTCRANTSGIFDYLSRGVPLETFTPTEEVITLTRLLVKQGLTGNFVFRAYPIGIQYLIEIWADAVRDHGPPGPIAVDVVKTGASYMMAWLDLITARLSEEHRRELERLARERSLSLVEAVRRVIDDPPTEAEAASHRLGYPLKGRHVAMILREPPQGAGPPTPVEAIVQDWGEALRAEHSLIVRVDARTSWCWLSLRPGPPRPWRPRQSGIVAGIGRPATGIAGFASSHRDAADALRVAERILPPGDTVVSFETASMAALCAAEPARLSAFIGDELGPLAGTGAAARRGRETLAAFYAANCNFRSAAAALGLHHNTIRYRLEQIEAQLGHPVGERRLQTELALHLFALFGASLSA